MRNRLATLLLVVGAGGCAHGAQAVQAGPATAPTPAPVPTSTTAASAAGYAPGELSVPNADPYPSTYKPFPSRPTLIEHATLLTAAGPTIHDGSILLRDGRIAAIGTNITAPNDAIVIDAAGKYVTPGIIDVHSHIAAGAVPEDPGSQLDEVNELTNPVTPYVWVEHSVWPQDPQLPRTLAGGVTTIQVLPGSGNLFGGRSVVLKVVPSRTVQGMKFPGAKYGLKMACGENPMRVYHARGPSTRMGDVAGYRAEWIQAEAYRRRWDKWNATHQGDPPTRDLGLETLADVLRGNILVHMHCYRADEMATILDMAREFGYKVRTFEHSLEGYKIADLLAADSVGASAWADWGVFKMEAADAVRANIALMSKAGVIVNVHSDDASGEQRLNQEAAKAIAEGRRIGIPITEDQAIRWLTWNPAWALGLQNRIGSLEVGKDADVVLWSGDPFSVYTRTEKVWVDGAPLFDRDDPAHRWRTDFELGFVPANQGGAR